MPSKRVDFKFERRFSDDSENGMAFGCLKEEFGDSFQDAVVNLVRLIYLPMALAESGASREAVEKASKKAREFVNEKTMAALGSCVDPSLNGFATTTSADVTSVQMLAPSKPQWTAQPEDEDELYQLDENKIY
jgi:hypothetical protein